MIRFIHRSFVSLAIVLTLCGLAAAQGGSYTVQFSASPTLEEAQAKASELKAKSVSAYIVKGVVPGKGVFYRVRAGNFPTQNDAKRFGAGLQQRGVISEYFITAYEKPTEDIAGAAPKSAPQVKPAPTASQPASNNASGKTSDNTPRSVAGAQSNPPVNSAPNPAPNPAASPPKNVELASSTSSVPSTTTSSGSATAPAAAAPPPAAAPPTGFMRYQDSKVGYSFDYPNYWLGQSLSDKEASDHRMGAGAVFSSQKDAAFLNAVWNDLDKANNPANENDLIVEVILKSMSAGDGTRLEETARRVENRNGVIKTYVDLKAAFQTQGQSVPLDFLGKAVIVRANRGILLVVTFYSKDSPPAAAMAADTIITSVRAPE